MKYLALIAIVVFGLSQQPTKAPEGKAVVKGSSAQVNDQANAGKDNKLTVQTPPVPNTEELKTQQELARFTGALVVVSLLQFVALIVQAWLFFRQTRIMDEHRVHLERLAIAASDNAKAAKDGAEAASKNAEFSKLNAVATEKSADAAKISADIAARVAVPTLVIAKFGVGETGAANLAAFLQYPQINIVIKNCGQTPAFLNWWTIMFATGELPDTPVYNGRSGCGIVLDKIIVEPNASYTLPELHFPHRQQLDIQDVQAVINHQKEFNVYGYICYGDLFGNPLKRLIL